VVAALGDFDVGEVARREPEARRAEVGNERRTSGDVEDCGLRIADCGIWGDDGLGLAELLGAAQGCGFLVSRFSTGLVEFREAGGDLLL
jgi:hypothetical protein